MVVFLKAVIEGNPYMPRSPVKCDGCAWRPPQSFEILGDILMRYSRRSPRLWINKRFLCFESIRPQLKLTLWSLKLKQWSLLLVVVERFLPFVLFRPLSPPFVFFAPQNRR